MPVLFTVGTLNKGFVHQTKYSYCTAYLHRSNSVESFSITWIDGPITTLENAL